MKYVKQMLIILFFCLAGELLALLPLPIPAAVYGLVLMLIALCTGMLKPDAIKETSNFLIAVMPLLFVAPAVGILAHWDIIAPNLVPISVIMVVTTLLTFAASGLVTKWLSKKKGDCDNG